MDETELISLCTISKYPEYYNRMLSVVRPYVDEVITVYGDKCHTGIIEVGKRYGCQVHFRQFDNDFSAQRNYGLEMAKGNWILVCDDDELPSFRLLNYLHKIHREDIDEYDLYRFVHNHYHRFWDRDFEDQCNFHRFFRNNLGLKFKNKVHEVIDLSGNLHSKLRLCDLPSDKGILFHENTHDKREEANSLYVSILSNKKSKIILDQKLKRK